MLITRQYTGAWRPLESSQRRVTGPRPHHQPKCLGVRTSRASIAGAPITKHKKSEKLKIKKVANPSHLCICVLILLHIPVTLSLQQPPRRQLHPDWRQLRMYHRKVAPRYLHVFVYCIFTTAFLPLNFYYRIPLTGQRFSQIKMRCP